MNKKNLFIVSFSILILLLAYSYRYLSNPTMLGDIPNNGLSISQVKSQKNEEESIQEVARNLSIPWEIVFLPDNSLLITERPGNLLHIDNSKNQSFKIEGVEHKGEGGLLGLALHPNFENNQWIYLYFTSKIDGVISNRVERYTINLQTNNLSNKKVIIDNIPGAIYHDGGRIAFGPDGYLYITTGDAGKSGNAQKIDSLAGKILRLTDQGEIPEDNLFKNAVYSYGHRNPQGIDWDNQNRLWSTEHGPSVIETGKDEINLISIGSNYGWPIISGNETQTNMIPPVIQSGSENTWAPGGMAIYNDTLFFAGLKGESLFSATIEKNQLTNLSKHFYKEFGRIRNIKIDPDNEWLYLLTSNTDGRGDKKEGDDKIIKIRIKDLLL